MITIKPTVRPALVASEPTVEEKTPAAAQPAGWGEPPCSPAMRARRPAPPGPTISARDVAAVRQMAVPLALTFVRDLLLTAAPSAGRGEYLAAASGVVKVGEHLLVVADDETQLAIFKDGKGTLLPLFADVLPADEKERKKVKPDLESLTLLSKDTALALGSGSTPARMRGALITLADDGAPTATKPIDLAPLYTQLLARFAELNIEGACVVGDALRLFQRGNGAKGEDAIIDVELSLDKIRTITPIDLGSLAGTKLSFTDACALPDGRIVFIAAAEASASTFNDGEVKGSAIGLIDHDGRVTNVRPLTPIMKAEGVHATLREDGGIDLLIVNDADDPSAPGKLYSATLPSA